MIKCSNCGKEINTTINPISNSFMEYLTKKTDLNPVIKVICKECGCVVGDIE